MTEIAKARHKATIHAQCPRGGWDYYEVEIVPRGFLLVEELTEALDKIRGAAGYQEELTERLAGMLGARVTTRGRHGTTDTEVTAG